MNKEKIEIRAHELCEKYSKCNQYQIKYRENLIIETLMNEFSIDRETAMECFMNNHK